MSFSRCVGFLFAVFICSLLATGLALKYAIRVRLLDLPSVRSSHTKPTPRGGGIAIVLTFFLALVALRLMIHLASSLVAAIGLGGGAIAIVGFVDDRKSLPARFRFLVQTGSAVIAVALIGLPRNLMGGGFYSLWALRLLSVFAIVWATNLFNFMDGIDGIASTEAIFFAGAVGALNRYLDGDAGMSLAIWSLGCASLGFLVWNWPPARIFMGDVGSGFLGFAMATSTLAMSHNHVVLINIAVILGAVFIVDATVTLIRRIARGDRWLDAHRIHAYQHLSRRWKSHRAVTISVGTINVGWLLPWAGAAAAFPNHANLFALIAIAPLIALAARVGAGAP